MMMRRAVVSLLAGALAASVAAAEAAAQIAKPSAYEGVASPATEDVSVSPAPEAAGGTTSSVTTTTPAVTSTTTVVTTAAPASTAPTDRYVIPGEARPAVTSSVAENSQPQGSSRPQLRQRPQVVDPDAGIVTVVPVKPGELAPGTVIKMRLDQELSTVKTQPGSEFSAHVTQDVKQDGAVLIPVNAVVRGRVLSVASGRRFRGPASIRLRPDEVILPDNSRLSLHADVVDTDAHNTTTDGEGNVVSKDHGKRTLGELALVGGSAAVVGAQVAGPTGALIGGAVGAGIITTHWLLQKHEATLPANSEIAIGLNEPTMLAPLHP